MSDPAPNLTDFLITYCTRLSFYRKVTLPSASICAICQQDLTLMDSGIVQIDLPPCQHMFDADCLSRYFLSGHNRCPLCHTVWFEKPEDLLAESDSLRARVQELELLLAQILDMLRIHLLERGVDLDTELEEGEELSQSRESVVVRRGDNGVWQEWRRLPPGRSEEQEFFNWSSNEGTLVGDAESEEGSDGVDEQ